MRKSLTVGLAVLAGILCSQDSFAQYQEICSKKYHNEKNENFLYISYVGSQNEEEISVTFENKGESIKRYNFFIEHKENQNIDDIVRKSNFIVKKISINESTYRCEKDKDTKICQRILEKWGNYVENISRQAKHDCKLDEIKKTTAICHK